MDIDHVINELEKAYRTNYSLEELASGKAMAIIRDRMRSVASEEVYPYARIPAGVKAPKEVVEALAKGLPHCRAQGLYLMLKSRNLKFENSVRNLKAAIDYAKLHREELRGL